MTASLAIVRVTAADIAAGEPGSSCFCPVAIAMNRTPGWSLAWVGFLWAWVDIEGQMMRCFFPPEVSEFIARFDRGEPVEPFAFEPEALQADVADGRSPQRAASAQTINWTQKIPVER